MTPEERLASSGSPPAGRGGMSEFALWMKPDKLLELLVAQRNDALEEAAVAISDSMAPEILEALCTTNETGEKAAAILTCVAGFVTERIRRLKT